MREARGPLENSPSGAFPMSLNCETKWRVPKRREGDRGDKDVRIAAKHYPCPLRLL